MRSFLDPRRVSEALRSKYDVRGPRYTSYPAAPHFQPLDPQALFDRWRERNDLDDDPGLSLYVHVPFCKVRCLFCGCHTLGNKADLTTPFLDTFEAEQALAARVIDPARPLRQLALGGGTPNYLDAAELERLLSSLEARWSFAPEAERSVELDPRVLSRDQLQVFLDHGFNRFSLGVQDFADHVLEAVGRKGVGDRVHEVVGWLRDAGQQRVNFDLIYGLPGQTVDTAAATAREAIRWRPSRIALYSYAHVPWMVKAQTVLEKRGLPDPDTKAQLFLTMADAFAEAGYVAVGMDHFALPDDPLVQALEARTLRRTFMGYTTGRGLDNLGFGPSAISWVGRTYSQNAKRFDVWQEGIAEGRLPVIRGHLLSRDDEIRRDLLLELFCTFHLDLDALSARWEIDARDYFAPELALLGPMVEDGLVELSDSAIHLSDTGAFFVRNVCMVFDAWLEKDPSQRRYSRTV